MNNKTLGIICLVLSAAAILGGAVNGTFADMGDDATAFGFIGAAVVLAGFGVYKLIKK